MSNSPVYSVDDILGIFQIAQSTFWKWAREGRFGDLVRIGRRTYVRREAVKALVGE
jgi:hypothetical protein